MWTIEEDLSLLEENLIHPKKWALISKKFFGRTQHTIKNRFILIMSKEFMISREKTRKLMNGKKFSLLVEKILNYLKLNYNLKGIRKVC